MSHKKAPSHIKSEDTHAAGTRPSDDPAAEHDSRNSAGAGGAEKEEGTALPAAEELNALVQQKEQERQELYDRLLRTMADYDNYKKRVSKEKDDLVRYGNEKIVRDLLPVLDNFERAAGQAESAADGAVIREGIELILKQLRTVLEKFGVKDFTSVGSPFDPNRHEAMVHQESTEHEENTVISEFQKGYYLHDRLLRPALVAVSKRPESSEAGDTPADVTVH